MASATPDLEALIERIHRDLRRERRQRKWRAGASARTRMVVAMVTLIAPLALGLFLVAV